MTSSEDYDQLLEKFEDEDNYERLVEDYEQLQDDYCELQNEHEKLKKDYKNLEEYFNRVMDFKNKEARNLHTRIHKLVIKAANLTC